MKSKFFISVLFLFLFSTGYAQVTPNPGNAGENFKFYINLTGDLPSGYSVKIELGDGGGGYLSAQTMNGSGSYFYYNSIINKPGNRVYRIGIFQGSTLKTDWANGTYTVNPAPSPIVTSVSPLSIEKGQYQDFTINGSNLPGDLVANIEGTPSHCTNVSGSGNKVVINCTATVAGNKRLYLKEVSGGSSISGSESIYINVTNTPSPKVTSVSPLSIEKGKYQDFTINGSNLPSNIVANIEGTPSHCTNVSGSGNKVVINCTATVSGNKRLYLKEGSGGSSISGSESIYINVTDTPSPTVTSVSPLSIEKGKYQDFTIYGSNLPSNIVANIEGTPSHCTNVSGSGNKVVINCTATVAGNKRLYLKEVSGSSSISGSESIYINVKEPDDNTTNKPPYLSYNAFNVVNSWVDLIIGWKDPEGDPVSNAVVEYRLQSSSTWISRSLDKASSTIDGNAFSTNFSLEPGDYTYRYKVQDSSGSTVIWDGNRTFTIKGEVNSAPSTPSISFSSTPEVNKSVSASVTVGSDSNGDQVGVKCYADDSNYTSINPYDSKLGSASRTVSPSFTFTSSGNKNVICYSYDEKGANSSVKTNSLTVSESSILPIPVINIAYGTKIKVGENFAYTVSFTPTSGVSYSACTETKLGGSSQFYVSNGQTVSASYSESQIGKITVECKTFTGHPSSPVKTSTPSSVEFEVVSATINKAPSSPNINTPTKVNTKESFTVSLSSGSDPENDKVKVSCSTSDNSWNIETPEGNGGTSYSYTKSFSSSGSKTISCTTIDSKGKSSAVATKSITVVGNSAPELSQNKTSVTDETVNFLAIFTDKDNDTLSNGRVRYKKQGSSTWSYLNLTQQTGTTYNFGASLKITDIGIYDYEFEISDSKGNSSDWVGSSTFSIGTKNNPPSVPQITSTITKAKLGEDVTITVLAGSDPDKDDTVQVQCHSYGSNYPSSNKWIGSGSSPLSATFKYTTAGPKIIYCITVDSTGLESASVSKTIEIEPDPNGETGTGDGTDTEEGDIATPEDTAHAKLDLIAFSGLEVDKGIIKIEAGNRCVIKFKATGNAGSIKFNWGDNSPIDSRTVSDGSETVFSHTFAKSLLTSSNDRFFTIEAILFDSDGLEAHKIRESVLVYREEVEEPIQTPVVEPTPPELYFVNAKGIITKDFNGKEILSVPVGNTFSVTVVAIGDTLDKIEFAPYNNTVAVQSKHAITGKNVTFEHTYKDEDLEFDQEEGYKRKNITVALGAYGTHDNKYPSTPITETIAIYDYNGWANSVFTLLSIDAPLGVNYDEPFTITTNWKAPTSKTIDKVLLRTVKSVDPLVLNEKTYNLEKINDTTFIFKFDNGSKNFISDHGYKLKAVGHLDNPPYSTVETGWLEGGVVRIYDRNETTIYKPLPTNEELAKALNQDINVMEEIKNSNSYKLLELNLKLIGLLGDKVGIDFNFVKSSEIKYAISVIKEMHDKISKYDDNVKNIILINESSSSAFLQITALEIETALGVLTAVINNDTTRQAAEDLGIPQQIEKLKDYADKNIEYVVTHNDYLQYLANQSHKFNQEHNEFVRNFYSVLTISEVIFPAKTVSNLFDKKADVGSIHGQLFEAEDIDKNLYTVTNKGKIFVKDNTPEIKLGFKPKYWVHNTIFLGKKVYQRDSLINPNHLDNFNRTNIERMREGLAPIGHDGLSINLHHSIQNDDSPIIELTETMHIKWSSTLHINDNDIESGIDRENFNEWRKEYWKTRANDFDLDFY